MDIDIYPCRVFVTMMDNKKPCFSICINDREIWKGVCEMTQNDMVTKKEWTEELESGIKVRNIVRVLSGVEANLLFAETITEKKE
jgi:hypothetical protein